jgi:hypothetical protein
VNPVCCEDILETKRFEGSGLYCENAEPKGVVEGSPNWLLEEDEEPNDVFDDAELELDAKGFEAFLLNGLESLRNGVELESNTLLEADPNRLPL